MTSSQNPPVPDAVDRPMPAPAPDPTSPSRWNVLAIVGFVGAFFVSLVGIVCGIIALGQIKRTGERGRGLAIWGIVIGALGLAVWVLVFSLVLAVGASTRSSIDDRVVGSSDVSIGGSSCDRVDDIVTRLEDELTTATSATTMDDLKVAAEALWGLSAELGGVAEDADDAAVSDAADHAATTVEELGDSMSDAVDSADPEAAVSDVRAKGEKVGLALAALGETCSG